MNSKIVQLTVTRQPYIEANYTDANSLHQALLTKPETVFPLMTRIFSSYQYYSDSPIYNDLVNTKRFTYVDGREFEWKIMGADTRPLVVTDKIETSSKPGYGHSLFSIVLDENWYLPGDVITPGTLNKKYQCRIQSGPVKYGSGYRYEIVLLNADPTIFLPSQYLEPGTRWIKMYSVYAEESDQAGSTQFAMPMSLRATIGRLKKQYGITGDAWNTVLAVQMVDDKGNKYTSWMRYVEVQFWQQWYKEIERYIWYGTNAGNQVKDANGRPVNSSPGIQEQLQDGNIHYYSVLTPKLLREYMMDIYYSRVRPGSRKRIRVYTGEAGMIQFHEAMQDLIAKNQFYIANSNFAPVTKTQSKYHNNAYAVGWQFIRYMMPNGSELEVVHNPIYDDQTIHLEKHPLTGRPLESYRYTFLDFEGDNFESNVLLVKKRNGFKLGYLTGLTGPNGPVNRGMIATKKDGYEMVLQDELGVIIKDVTRTGELILAVN